ncbi:aldo/keto reductase [Nocardia vinacea]|uniref:aldo/keto reductase n=1 Tax=Nocardia vinacea TaxID=96468 RepID=UPI001C3F4D42
MPRSARPSPLPDRHGRRHQGRPGADPRGRTAADHGLSNVDTDQLAEARAIAPVAAVQSHFHAGKRDDTELLRACEEACIAFVPFFPLGGGTIDLTGNRMAMAAQRHGATVAQIALAWLLASSPVTLAIPGTGSPPIWPRTLPGRSPSPRKISPTSHDTRVSPHSHR